VQPVIHTPGSYADLSHIIAVITITMAVLALIRLRPAIRRARHKLRRTRS
jgi:hypothetical protein